MSAAAVLCSDEDYEVDGVVRSLVQTSGRSEYALIQSPRDGKKDCCTARWNLKGWNGEGEGKAPRLSEIGRWARREGARRRML